VIGAVLPLLVQAAAPLPAPVENGLQPPMTFACRLSGEAYVVGRISRFYGKAVPGMGLMAIPDAGGYRDHVIVEIQRSSLPGLAGRYDIVARFPLKTDKMILALPAVAGSGGYTLTASPAKFGIGYQAFTALRVERTQSSTAAWTGSCATTLPKPDKKP